MPPAGSMLYALGILAIYIDGVIIVGHSVVVAIGVDDRGEKHLLELTLGVTENATVVVPTKGLGFWFQASKNSSMALCRSATLANEPRRILLLVNSPNQRLTRFNQLELVGTKRQTKRVSITMSRIMIGHSYPFRLNLHWKHALGSDSS